MKESGKTTHRVLQAKEISDQQRRYEASGLNVTAFCRNEGVAESTFYRRRAQLKQGKGAMHRVVGTMMGGKGGAGFIDAGPMVIAVPGDGVVRAQREAAREQAAGVEVRLELGGGLVLYVRRT